MAAILDLGQNEDCHGWIRVDLFFLFLHTSKEFISGEKPLLTFLSNLSRSLLRLLTSDIYSEINVGMNSIILQNLEHVYRAIV